MDFEMRGRWICEENHAAMYPWKKELFPGALPKFDSPGKGFFGNIPDPDGGDADAWSALEPLRNPEEALDPVEGLRGGLDAL